jgi:hypothetical protein
VHIKLTKILFIIGFVLANLAGGLFVNAVSAAPAVKTSAPSAIHKCTVLPCPVCGKGKPTNSVTAVTYSGQATAVNLTNLHVGPPFILIGDTGALLSTGGNLHASVATTNLDNSLVISLADADATGADNQAHSEVRIEGFDIILLTTNNVQHRLTLTTLDAEVSASCSSTGVVLSGGVEIDGLTLDGTPVTVTGAAGQTLTFDEFSIIFNEQDSSLTLTNGYGTIAAIHIIVNDCMHGYVGFVHADITCDGTNTPPVVDCPDFVTGGGWIVTSSGAKANFGVGGGIRNGDFWGHLNFIDHGAGLHVKATSVTDYTLLDAVTRQIDYQVTINGAPGSARVIVANQGEPGRNDTFSIALSTGYSQGGTLGGDGPGGGNIQLHAGKCGPGHGGPGWDCQHRCDKCDHKCHRHDHKPGKCDHKCDRSDHHCPWDQNKCEHQCDKCDHKCEHHDHRPGKHKCDRKDHKCPWDQNKCVHKCDKCSHKCENHDHKPGNHVCDRKDHKCPWDENKCVHQCDKCGHQCEHHDHKPGKCNHKCDHKDHKCDVEPSKGKDEGNGKGQSKGKDK